MKMQILLHFAAIILAACEDTTTTITIAITRKQEKKKKKKKIDWNSKRDRRDRRASNKYVEDYRIERIACISNDSRFFDKRICDRK